MSRFVALTACWGVACVAFLSSCLIAPIQAAQQPNIVLVITDDQGYGDLHCHGNEMIRTPNLDQLHAQSTRLTNFHVDPTCAPTRSALLTGRYSSRTGVWHTIAGRSLMRADEQTLAEVLSAAGYRTGIFGKWHLGDNFPARPQDQGFQTAVIHGGGGVTQTPDYWGNDYFDDTYFRNGKPEKFTGYCTDVWFDEALKFIETKSDKPFFCYLPTNAPHGPYFVADEYQQPYLDQGVPATMAAFYGMITNIDDNMGRLVAKLDELKLADNTILIFTSDNGTAAGLAKRGEGGSWRGFNDGMRGTKGSQYEGGHRVPFFVRWPARMQGGRDIDALTAHIDVLPTLVELTGIEARPGKPIDGSSLAPLLLAKEGEQVKWPQRTLTVHSQRIETPEKWRNCAVMTERWRLVDGKELYDMQADPGQEHNVAEEHSAVVEDLRHDYELWWKSISKRFEEYVRIGLGSTEENPTHITCHDWHAELPDVPWNQASIERDPLANGWWAVQVESPGRYEVTLRQRPEVAGFPIEARAARLKLGDVDLSQAVEAGATAVTFRVELREGPASMQTWFEDSDGQTRGAFFVEVKHVR